MPFYALFFSIWNNVRMRLKQFLWRHFYCPQKSEQDKKSKRKPFRFSNICNHILDKIQASSFRDWHGRVHFSDWILLESVDGKTIFFFIGQIWTSCKRRSAIQHFSLFSTIALMGGTFYFMHLRVKNLLDIIKVKCFRQWIPSE